MSCRRCYEDTNPCECERMAAQDTQDSIAASLNRMEKLLKQLLEEYK